MPSFVRRAVRLTVAVGLGAATLAGIVAAGAAVIAQQSITQVQAVAREGWPTPRASSADGPIVVAIVLGASPTVASDVLAPYEVFASSPQFSVYTVAASGAPATLEGGPAVLPTHTFAEVDSGSVPRPDVVVVPAVAEPDGDRESPLRTFLIDQSARGTRILGVCNGSAVLAATGLLDGRQATSHWSRIGALQESRPQVTWVRGTRYVQDGSVTTTAGVTSGIPGALRVMADLAGVDEAERVGRTLNYPGWAIGGSAGIPDQRFAWSDVPIGLNAIMPWLRPTVGIALADGDSEIDVAGAFEVYNVSYAARAIALSTGDTITTRHGLVLVTTPLGSAPAIDWMLVPGARTEAEVAAPLSAWAAEHSVSPTPLNRSAAENGFDGALQQLANATDSGTAVSAAKMIDYPTDHLTLASPRVSWRAPLLLAAAVLVAVGAGLLPGAIRRHRSRRADPIRRAR